MSFTQKAHFKVIAAVALAFSVIMLWYVSTRDKASTPPADKISNINKVSHPSKAVPILHKSLDYASPLLDDTTSEPIHNSQPTPISEANAIRFTVSVTVINGITGEPMPEMEIRFYPKGDSWRSVIPEISGNSGLAQFSDVPPGYYGIYVTLGGPCLVSQEKESYFDANDTGYIFKFDKFDPYEITVLDVDDNPITNTGFSMDTALDLRATRHLHHSFTTNDHGKLIFEDYIPGSIIKIEPQTDLLLGSEKDEINLPWLQIGKDQKGGRLYAAPFEPFDLCVGVVNMPAFYKDKDVILDVKSDGYFNRIPVTDEIACLAMPRTDRVQITARYTNESPHIHHILYDQQYQVGSSEKRKDIFVDLSAGKRVVFRTMLNTGEPIENIGLEYMALSLDNETIRRISTSKSDANGMITTTIPPCYKIKVKIEETEQYKLSYDRRFGDKGDYQFDYDKLSDKTIDIVVEQLTLLAGEVIDQRGKPWHDVDVWAFNGKLPICEQVETDENGEYRLLAYTEQIKNAYIIVANIEAGKTKKGGVVVCVQEGMNHAKRFDSMTVKPSVFLVWILTK